MITLPPKLYKQFETIYKMIKSGDLRTLIPLLSLFELNGKPMGLENHFQLAPMFSVVQPQQMCMMLARQSGKSVSLSAASGIRSMLIPNYHQVIVQPQFEMIKRLNNTIYQPILRSCPLINNFISPVELSKMTLKVFKNNSMTFMEHAFMSPDRLRGISGASCVTVDECLLNSTLIKILDIRSKKIKFKRIDEVLDGDVCISMAFSKQDTTVMGVVNKPAAFRGIRSCYKLTTRSGKTVICSSGHRFQTNHGIMRLEEIVEYEYNRRSQGNWHDGRTSERYHGKSHGGCSISQLREANQSYSLESLGQTDGLCATQIPDIARIRYQRTAVDAESRLRRILGTITSERDWGVSLYVYADASKRAYSEDDYKGLLGADNTSNSSSLVVYGRWVPRECNEYSYNCDKWILRGRGYPSITVDETKMGSRYIIAHNAASFGKDRIYAVYSSTYFPDLCQIDRTLCTRMHEVQNATYYVCLPILWDPTLTLSTASVLFGGVQEKTIREEKTRKSHCSTSQEKRSGIQGAFETESSRCVYAEKGGSGKACKNVAVATQSSSIQRTAESSERACETTEICTKSTSGGALQRLVGQTQFIIGNVAGGTKSISIRAVACERGEEKGCQRGRPEPDGGVQRESPRSREKATRESNRGTKSSQEAKRKGIQNETPGKYDRGGARKDQSAETCELSKEYSYCSCRSGFICGVSEKRQFLGETHQRKTSRTRGFIEDPIVSIVYAGKHPVYDIEVIGMHNFLLANGIVSHNCQDINWEFIPIIEECMSASINWGFSIYTGTPKTTDNTLSLLWNRSSQAEWVIPCSACGFFNIPNPEQHLLKMIGKHGPICAKCGKPLIIERGGWVHGYPDRALTFPGFHLAQPIHKLHSINDLKWSRLVHKTNTLSTITLWNECLGWPYDDATSPLTLTDLINAEFDPLDKYGTKITIKNPEDVQQVAHNYSYITIGCDWGGGSAISDSYTAFAVVGLRRDNQVMDVLYYERIPKGVSPTDEARILMSWIRGTKAKAFTFDNGGAGFVRTEMMKHEGLSDIDGLKVIPQQYGPPRGGDVMRLAKAQRETDLTYYITDKSRSLAMCIAGIKAQRVRIPHFNHEDENDPIRDFLALIEDPRDIRGRDVVILIGRKAGRPDDLAHAVNFACCQIGDAFGAYLPIGRKYDTSKLEPLDEAEEDEIVYGPRGDFDRFQDAISANCAIIEPDDYYDF